MTTTYASTQAMTEADLVVRAAATGNIVRAGQARNYAEAQARYGDQLVAGRCTPMSWSVRRGARSR